MSRKNTDFDAVRRIGAMFPGVEEATVYGMPALKVHGQMMACMPSHRSAEPNSLVVRVDLPERAQLLAEAPDVYYVTEHYAGFTGVLVRLSRVDPGVLRDLLGMAYKFVTRSAESHSSTERAERRAPKPDISNNVGPVKSFLSALLRSLRRVVFVVLC